MSPLHAAALTKSAADASLVEIFIYQDEPNRFTHSVVAQVFDNSVLHFAFGRQGEFDGVRLTTLDRIWKIAWDTNQCGAIAAQVHSALEAAPAEWKTTWKSETEFLEFLKTSRSACQIMHDDLDLIDCRLVDFDDEAVVIQQFNPDDLVADGQSVLYREDIVYFWVGSPTTIRRLKLAESP